MSTARNSYVSGLAAIALVAARPVSAAPVGTAFTYQGRLENPGGPDALNVISTAAYVSLTTLKGATR